jgi:hypothetical protein
MDSQNKSSKIILTYYIQDKNYSFSKKYNF